MVISPTLFLKINLLLIVLFPYAKMFTNNSSNEAAAYGRAFVSSALFIIVYCVICFPDFTAAFKYNFPIEHIAGIFAASACCLLLEGIIIYMRYGTIKIIKMKTTSLGILFFAFIGIPVLEEILYIAALHVLCTDIGIHDYFFVLLSGLAFGLGHLRYPKINILTKTIWGIIFAALYILTKNIYMIIGAHMLNNSILALAGAIQRHRQ